MNQQQRIELLTDTARMHKLLGLFRARLCVASTAAKSEEALGCLATMDEKIRAAEVAMTLVIEALKTEQEE